MAQLPASPTPTPTTTTPPPTATPTPTASPSPTPTAEEIMTSPTKFKTIDTSKWVTIKQALDPNFGGKERTKWIFEIWNYCLSLVNVIVAGILIFLAFVNILRIQIDTYALKKSLPTLIIAVILANFSMLICRMVVDFSDVLTRTFAGNPAQLAADLQQALGLFPKAEGIGSEGEATAGAFASLGIAGLAIVGIFVAPAITLIVLLLGFILGVLPAIAILILAVLLYVRTGIIYALVAISPLAWICMALPATQGLFRQWWGQFARWVFMAPVVFFLLKIASMVKGDPKDWDIWAFAIGLGMLYLAIQVPFKMGGAIMAVWGGLGKRIGAAGLRHGLRVADRKFGQATKKIFGKPYSPLTLYEGWKRASELEDQRYMAAGTGAAMELRSGITGIPGRAWRLAKEGITMEGIKGLVTPELKYMTAAHAEALKPHLEMARHLQFEDEKSLDNAYQAAIKDKNTDEAMNILLAKGMKGTVKSSDFEEYAKIDSLGKKKAGAQVSAITNSLFNQVAQASKNTINPISNPYELDKSRRNATLKNTKNVAAEISKDLHNQLEKNPDTDYKHSVVQRALTNVVNMDFDDFRKEGYLKFLNEISNHPLMNKFPDTQKNIKAVLSLNPQLETRIENTIKAGGFSEDVANQLQNIMSHLMTEPIDAKIPLKGRAQWVVDFNKNENALTNLFKQEQEKLKSEVKNALGREVDIIKMDKKTMLELKSDLRSKVQFMQTWNKKMTDLHNTTGKKVKDINDLISKYKKSGTP